MRVVAKDKENTQEHPGKGSLLISFASVSCNRVRFVYTNVVQI